MTDTVLTLSAIGLGYFSSRGVTESLKPIDGGRQARTINGTLVDLSLPQHRKYSFTLQFGDVQPIGLDGVYKGLAVTVGCITELGKSCTITSLTGTASLSRAAVSGSGRAIMVVNGVTYIASNVTFDTAGTTATVTFPAATPNGTGQVYYRPSLAMMVTGFGADTDEWAAKPGATLELEEV
jgi:hypothetical protein